MDGWGELVWTAPDLAPGPPPVVRWLIIEVERERQRISVGHVALLLAAQGIFLGAQIAAFTIVCIAAVIGLIYLAGA